MIIYKKEFDQFDLIIANTSADIFTHFNVSKLAGLSKSECYDYDKNSYISGLTNKYLDRPFVFLNTNRLNTALIVHESVHLARLLMSFPVINDHNEEVFAEMTETYFKKIRKEIKKIKNLI